MKDASLAASSTRLQAGTPAYMAPEQFEGCSATEKVDVFSFAVLLWECCEQQQPWRDLSPMQIIYAVGLQVRGGCCFLSRLDVLATDILAGLMLASGILLVGPHRCCTGAASRCCSNA
jgi:serine/threonine protein kinase